MNTHKNQGFTLIELIITVALVAILSAFSAPPMMQWLENQTYKEQARKILQNMQFARSEAISKNLEHRVVVDVPNKQYRLEVGDKSAGTQTGHWSDPPWTLLPANVAIKSGTNCDGNSEVTFHFNTNGSSSTGYICIFDPQNMSQEKYKVGVAMATSGRPTIE